MRVITGASSGEEIDEGLAVAKAISWRAPYQSGAALRKQINVSVDLLCFDNFASNDFKWLRTTLQRKTD